MKSAQEVPTCSQQLKPLTFEQDVLIFFFMHKGPLYKHPPVTTHLCTLPFQHNVGAGWLVPRCPIYPYFHHLSTSRQVKHADNTI